MAKGWVRVAQRCGRYAYRKVWVRVTNPDHYEPSSPAPGHPSLEVKVAVNGMPLRPRDPKTLRGAKAAVNADWKRVLSEPPL